MSEQMQRSDEEWQMLLDRLKAENAERVKAHNEIFDAFQKCQAENERLEAKCKALAAVDRSIDYSETIHIQDISIHRLEAENKAAYERAHVLEKEVERLKADRDEWMAGFKAHARNVASYCVQLNDAKEENERLKSGWISVEDRLPDEDSICWVFHRYVDQDWFIDGRFASDNKGELAKYWMPVFVPEPPEGEK